MTPRDVAAALGIDVSHGYTDSIARVGQQLDKLWKHGIIQCTTLQRKQRRYWINPETPIEKNDLSNHRTSRADRLDRDCIYPSASDAADQTGMYTVGGTESSSDSAVRRHPDRIPGRRRW